MRSGNAPPLALSAALGAALACTLPSGPATASYLAATARRLALIGALVIAAACIAPEVCALLFGLPCMLSGYRLFLLAWTGLDVLDAAAALRADASTAAS